jgi:hypothetical protein
LTVNNVEMSTCRCEVYPRDGGWEYNRMAMLNRANDFSKDASMAARSKVSEYCAKVAAELATPERLLQAKLNRIQGDKERNTSKQDELKSELKGLEDAYTSLVKEEEETKQALVDLTISDGGC